MDVSNVELHQLVKAVRERDGKRRSLREYGQYCRVAYSIAFHDPRRCEDLNDLIDLALRVPNWPTITRAEVGLLVARGADVVWHAETAVGVLELDPQHGTTLVYKRIVDEPPTPPSTPPAPGMYWELDMVGRLPTWTERPEPEQARKALEGLQRIHAANNLGPGRFPTDEKLKGIAVDVFILMRSLGMEVN